jgi:hypothetical protein
VNECREIADQRRPVGQQFEGHRGMLHVVPFDYVPQNEANSTNDERCENMSVRPRIRLAAPDETDGK